MGNSNSKSNLDKKIDEIVVKFIPFMVDYYSTLDMSPESLRAQGFLYHQTALGIMQGIGLYRSSKRLEALSRVLIFLTGALVLLTAVLILRTFL